MSRLDVAEGPQGPMDVVVATVQGPVALPATINVFAADFARAGPDLVIAGGDGPSLRIVDYFRLADPPDLVAANGAILRGDVAARLAGPEAPGQYAQAGAVTPGAPIGQVETLRGTAEVQRADGTVEALSIGAKVYQNDVVATGDGAILALTFVDGTIFSLAASSRMVLDALIYDPGGTGNSATFNLIEGGFVFIAGQVARTGGMEINTPAATMGIRGTTLRIDIGLESGVAEVAVTLEEDPVTGETGRFLISDLQGNPLATVETTDTTWIIRPGEPIEAVDRLPLDLTEAALFAAARFAFDVSRAREAAGEPFVPPGGNGSPNAGDDPPGGDPLDLQTDEGLGPVPEDPDDSAPAPDAPNAPGTPGEGDGFERAPPSDPPPGGTEGPEAPDDARLDLQEDGSTFARLDVAGGSGAGLTFALAEGARNGQVLLSDDGFFRYTPDPDFAGTDSFTYTVTDATGASDTGTITVSVAAVNDAPTAAPLALSVEEDGSGSGRLAGADVDSATLRYMLVEGPENGTLTLDAATGAFTYTPDADFAGGDAFSYRVTDGAASSAPAAVAITVAPVNDAPVARAAAFTVDEDGTLAGPGAQVGGTDADSGPLEVVVVSSPASGALSLDPATGAFTYTPDADFFGEDSFQFVVVDAAGAQSAVSTARITVTPVNDAPVADGLIRATPRDTELSDRVTGQDAEGDALTFRLIDGPANGSLSFDAATGAFTYGPDPGFAGADGFRFAAFDGTEESAPQAVRIEVAGENTAPEATPAVFDTREDTPLTGPGATVGGTDADGDALTVLLVSGPANGALTLDGETGAFTYTPAANFFGEDEFAFRVVDAQGAASGIATATLRVAAVNDAPVAAPAAFNLTEDTVLTGPGVFVTGTDVEPGRLGFQLVAGPENGTLDLDTVTGAFTYTPDADFSGEDSFAFRVVDAQGAQSQTAVATLTVTPVNDAPEPAPLTRTTREDVALTDKVTASDADGDSLAFRILSGPANGTATLDAASGAFTYTPDANFTGTDTFTFAASDGVAERAAAVTIEVGAENDAPTATPASFTTPEDIALSGPDAIVTGTDVEPGDLDVVVVAGPSHGVLDLDGETGAFSYVPDADFFGEDSFSFRVVDEGGAQSQIAVATITVTPANDAPEPADDRASTTEDTPIGITAATLLANDTDRDAGDTLSLVGVDGTETRGTVRFDGTTVTYDPNGAFEALPAGASVTDSFAYTVTDGTESRTAAVTLTVFGVNDAPVPVADTASTTEDTPVEIPAAALLANDTDIDTGDVLTLTGIEGAGTRGAVTFDGTTVTYDPNGAFDALPDGASATDTFTYAVTDGAVTRIGAVTVTVSGRNDPPTARDVRASGLEDTEITVVLSGADPEGDALSYRIVSGPALGVLRPGGAPDTFVYRPEADAFGADAFTFLAVDANGAESGLATAALTVAPVNDDAPVPEDLITETRADTAVSGSVTATDPDGDALIFGLDSAPSHGSASVSSDGGFDYVPNAGFTGVDSFTIRVSDGTATETATIRIGVGEAESVEAGGQTLSIGIDRAGSDAQGAGSIGLFATEPMSAPINLVFVLDSSGSIGAEGWSDMLSNVSQALDLLAARFAPSQTPVEVQVVSFSAGASLLPGGPYALTTELPALKAALAALPFQNSTTNWQAALDTTRAFLTTQAATEDDLVYFITDGNPVPSSQPWQQAQADLVVARPGIAIEAVAIGSGVSLANLVEIDTDAQTPRDIVRVDDPDDLFEAFAGTPLFAAELETFSLDLVADGVLHAGIATEASPFLVQQGPNAALALAEVPGIADLIGETNEVLAAASFDLNGGRAGGLAPVHLVETASFSIGSTAVDSAGTPKADLIMGSTRSDTLSGGQGDDLLVAGAGADVLIGGAGRDTLLGGAGDDVLSDADPTPGASYDGGDGRDILRLGDADQLPSLDLRGIEVIDMENDAADSFTLTAEDVLDLSEGGDTDLEALLGRYLPESVTVLGESGDTVALGSGARATGETVTGGARDLAIYDFTDGAGEVLATLAVDADIAVTMPPNA
ncbi:MAG: Ig-like domain-containing protein [Pseudomonadota bacterium]